ncbi:MAG TPA: hypothetical protein VMN38_04290 [Sphingomicrobium sp.]|nr:hypothetical protein [Sphingomicrobium sp.]
MKLRILPILLVSLLSACSRQGDIEDGGVFITRSACPLVGIPAATGDITVFNPPQSRDAAAIDVTATITNLFANCDETGDRIMSNAAFDVVAVRSDAGPARQVVLPFFSVAVQGGSQIVAKRVGQVALNFPEGSQRAQTKGQAVIWVSRAAATLPANVREILTRRRRAGDPEAAVDPLTDPTVRAAVARATFEHLVGFQMSPEMLRYNATR